MMIEGFRRWLTVAGVVGTGLMGGFFFAFSTIVMTGLRRLPGEQGLHAMQSINKAANTSPALLVGLFGTGAISAILGVAAVTDLDEPASTYLLLGGALYLVGVLGLTIGYHVPRNEALALVDAASTDAARLWRHYASTWTAWNHVRTFAALAAAVSYTLALRAT